MSKLSNYDGLVHQRFIETGLYVGATMIEAAKQPFQYLDGIEINAELANRCREHFSDDPRVTIHRGTSPDILRRILRDEPTTFWLDAHFSGTPCSRDGMMDPELGECPLLEELDVITSFVWTVLPIILIDDAHMFSEAFWGTPGSEHFTRSHWPDAKQIEAALPGFVVTESAGVLYAAAAR